MPTYAYVCADCGHSFDIVQAITDDALSECPACGGQLRKKFHPVGVAFKGSGFYRTDSRAGSSGSTDGSDGSAPKTESGSSPKPDTANSGSKGSTNPGSSSSTGGSSSAGAASKPATTGS